MMKQYFFNIEDKKIKTEEHNLNQRRAEDASLTQDHNNNSNGAALSANENTSTETNDETINIENENITEDDASLIQDQNNSSNSAEKHFRLMKRSLLQLMV